MLHPGTIQWPNLQSSTLNAGRQSLLWPGWGFLYFCCVFLPHQEAVCCQTNTNAKNSPQMFIQVSGRAKEKHPTNKSKQTQNMSSRCGKALVHFPTRCSSSLSDWFRNACFTLIISIKATVQRCSQRSKKKTVPFREERGVTEDSAVNVVSTLADACHVLILPPGSQAALN